MAIRFKFATKVPKALYFHNLALTRNFRLIPPFRVDGHIYNNACRADALAHIYMRAALTYVHMYFRVHASAKIGCYNGQAPYYNYYVNLSYKAKQLLTASVYMLIFSMPIILNLPLEHPKVIHSTYHNLCIPHSISVLFHHCILQRL